MPIKTIKRLSPRRAVVAGAAVLVASGGAVAMASPANAAPTDSAPASSSRQIARQMIPNDTQYSCFSNIVQHESSWDHTAVNPTSGSYGLVQALPATKMASAGSDWKTNPKTQIKWGLDYMNDRYGSPCDAWAFWQNHHWY
ncbi:hypothetical protein AQ490_03790 [Wenjunlia vitaminophila]|uniref:Transglycosylase SLT domain-containing protein n=1 Tax=Wenjunlia vitaminophila TaxID=76728 RepID=A0A0T6LT96_WENVI|nr:transglycosylase SLT domain-containing protein [Wenjunlia vitaminophila]KRV49322.1 hypothetical protein AQ490_03790 [Wenjunlia vitaminophila]